MPSILCYAPESVREKLNNLASLGIDGPKVINAMPSILSFAPESVREKLNNLAGLGIDGPKIINAMPSILSLAPESVKAKLRILYSTARAWQVENYRLIINKLVEANPMLLSYKPDRNRVLVRIISNSIASNEDMDPKRILAITNTNLEATLAAYLENKHDIHQPEELIKLSRRYKKLGKEALLEIIRLNVSEDSVLKIYRRAYIK